MEKQENQKMEIVHFRDADLILFETDAENLVALKPICDGMSMDWGGQYQKVKKDEMLNSVISLKKTTGADGRFYEMVCLPIEYIPFWLATVKPERVKNPAAREAVIVYRREVVRVLFEHFILKKATAEKNLDRTKDDLRIEHEWRCIQKVDFYIEKYFKDTGTFWDARRFWWMNCCFTKKKIAEQTKESPGRVSRLIRLYNIYLDITNLERQDTPRHSVDNVHLREVGYWAELVYGMKSAVETAYDMIANPGRYIFPEVLRDAYRVSKGKPNV